MKPLTSFQRKALELAKRKGGVQIAKGRKARDEVTAYMAAQLIERGWVRRIGGTLFIEKEGRQALNAPIPARRTDVFLAQFGGTRYKTLPSGRQVEDTEEDDLTDRGYTTRASKGLRGCGAVLDPPRRDWRTHAEALRKASRSDADAIRLSGLPHPEERLAELRRMAEERGLDIAAEMRYVKHGLKVLERKVRQEDERAA